MNLLLSEALQLARMGYSVCACEAWGATPVTERGLLDATQDETTIRAWWARWPEANVAVVLSRGVIVVDAGPGWPATQSEAASIRSLKPPTAIGPHDGRQYWFRVPPDCSGCYATKRLAPNATIHTAGSYVLVAPSYTQDGYYGWANYLVPPDELPLVPDWLAVRLLPATALTDEPKGGAL